MALNFEIVCKFYFCFILLIWISIFFYYWLYYLNNKKMQSLISTKESIPALYQKKLGLWRKRNKNQTNCVWTLIFFLRVWPFLTSWECFIVGKMGNWYLTYLFLFSLVQIQLPTQICTHIHPQLNVWGKVYLL